MSLAVKHSGTWRYPHRIYTKSSGSWRNVRQVFTKSGGVWHPMYYLFDSVTVSSNGSLYGVSSYDEFSGQYGGWVFGNVIALTNAGYASSQYTVEYSASGGDTTVTLYNRSAGTPFAATTKTGFIEAFTVGGTTKTTTSADAYTIGGGGTFCVWAFWGADHFGLQALDGSTVGFWAQPA